MTTNLPWVLHHLYLEFLYLLYLRCDYLEMVQNTHCAFEQAPLSTKSILLKSKLLWFPCNIILHNQVLTSIKTDVTDSLNLLKWISNIYQTPKKIVHPNKTHDYTSKWKHKTLTSQSTTFIFIDTNNHTLPSTST